MKSILRRLMFYLVAFWVAITLNFFIPRAMPGDPASMMFVGFKGKMPVEAMNNLKKAYGFDGSLFHQYKVYLSKLCQGDFGPSVIAFPESANKNLKYAATWTMYLVGVTTSISFIIGTFMGMFSAWRRGGFFDSFFTPFNVILSSFSPAVVALLLFYGFCLEWELFPLGRAHSLDINPSLSWPFIKDVIFHSIMPICSILIVTVGGWHLGMRNNMINLLNEDFVTMARAKGLSNSRVMYKYAARNAVLPVITQLAMCVGFIFGGAIFTEVVFNYPGLGKFTLTAIQSRDYSFIQGQLLFITAAVLIANFITDIINIILDPRLRHTGAK